MVEIRAESEEPLQETWNTGGDEEHSSACESQK